MITNRDLISVLRDPGRLLNYDAEQFAALMRLAHWEILSGRLADICQEKSILEKLDPVAAEAFNDALLITKSNQQRMKFELSRIDNALQGYGGPKILLKGLAYMAIDLPGSEGRMCSDVDFLSPRNDLREIEGLLRSHGWQQAKTDAYDDHYYREWMHELPPMRHHKRGIIVDIHHAILPPTARLKPSSTLLLSEAKDSRIEGWKVLDGPDMALHCALHTFYDGDLMGGLRGVFDFSDIMDGCVKLDSDFHRKLKRRSVELGVIRPLAYALRYLRLVLGDESHKALERDVAHSLPSKPVLSLMDHLVRSMMLETSAWRREWGGWQRTCLYMRSHWLRMPPMMLAKHLMRKAFKKRTS